MRPLSQLAMLSTFCLATIGFADISLSNAISNPIEGLAVRPPPTMGQARRALLARAGRARREISLKIRVFATNHLVERQITLWRPRAALAETGVGQVPSFARSAGAGAEAWRLLPIVFGQTGYVSNRGIVSSARPGVPYLVRFSGSRKFCLYSEPPRGMKPMEERVVRHGRLFQTWNGFPEARNFHVRNRPRPAISIRGGLSARGVLAGGGQ